MSLTALKSKYNQLQTKPNILGLVSFYLSQGSHLEALNILEKHLLEFSKDPEYLFALGSSYHASNQFEKAIENYKNVLALDDAHAYSLLNMALCYERLNSFDNALKAYQSPIVKKLKSPEVFNNHANLLFKISKYSDALGLYNQGLAIDSKNPLLLKNSSKVLLKLGHNSEFEKRVSQLKRLGYKRESDKLKIDNLVDKQNFELAIVSCEQYLKEYPSDHEVEDMLVNLLVSSEKVEQAIQLADKNWKANGSISAYSLAFALSYSRNDSDLERSSKVLKSILSNQPNNLLAHDCLAQNYIKLGYLDEAKKILNSDVFLDLQILPASILNGLQEKFSLLKRYDKSLHVLNYLLTSTDATKSTIYRDIGINYLKLEQAQNAFDALMNSYNLNPQDQRLIAHLILAAKAIGKNDFVNILISKEKYLKAFYLEDLSDDFLQALKDKIMSHKTLKWEPKGLATKRGFMTENFNYDAHDILAKFSKEIDLAIENYISALDFSEPHFFVHNKPKKFNVHIWAVALEESGFVGPHIHEDSWLSGAFYLDFKSFDDNNSKQGWLKFMEPHDEVPYKFEEIEFYVQPEVGKVVLFPSYYFHSTVPYETKQNRISIAFDVQVTEWS